MRIPALATVFAAGLAAQAGVIRQKVPGITNNVPLLQTIVACAS
ncbi:MAG TPA: hypothetical protein VH417_12060 [Vicinamibacterales bacterium]|jgi:hypothetical protein